MDDENLGANHLVRLEKFKRWAKKNLFALSVVAIAVAGVITAVVMVTRSALRKGSTSTKQAKKIIDHATKKDEGPCAPFLKWIAKVATLGSRGLN